MIEAETVPTQVLLAGLEETIAGQLAGILQRKKPILQNCFLDRAGRTSN